MHDIVVTDIPQEHYDWICEGAAKLGITPDDYLTTIVKEYAKGLRASERDEKEAPK